MKTLAKIGNVCAVLALFVGGAAFAQGSEKSEILLPSAQLRSYLEKKPRGTTRGTSPVITTNVLVKQLPKDSWYSNRIPPNDSLSQPLRSANELMILFKPNVTGAEIDELLEKHKLAVLDAAPQIGSITVDASTVLGPEAVPSSASSLADLTKSGLSELIQKIRQDQRVIEVTPNTVISQFGIKSAIEPTPLRPSPEVATERVDWGVADCKFDQYWEATANELSVVGVIDVGFADHEDLTTRKGFEGSTIPSNDHGNHVAGIMCAKHNDIGIKGALKNCVTVISAGQLLLVGGNQPQGAGVSPFKTRFSEYLATVLEFMEKNPDVKIINLSLGYNWMPNFGIDPRLDDAVEIRNEVQAQGRFFAAVLMYAQARDVALVSAAGNDSSALAKPLEAKWASPFNFGTLLVEENYGWTNGLIVEAHDSSHRRVDFSNVGGHISCPGKDVLSLLATSKKAYGTMSGTSMASPYCAAGLAIVRAKRPELTLREALQCLRSSPDKVGNVPRLNLEYSIAKCQPPPAQQ